MRLKLIIVDDEEEIREGIKNAIHWEDNGVEVIGTAANGHDALELLVKKKPDIALLDIKMPGLSGFEVMEKANKLQLNTKFIIVSGFEDFSFAQRAMRLNAEDYILKPSRPSEILKIVLKVATLIYKEMGNREQIFKNKEEEGLSPGKDYLMNLLEDYRAGGWLPENEGLIYPLSQEKALFTCIQCGNVEDLKEAFKEFYDAILEANISEADIIKCAIVFLIQLYRLQVDRKVRVKAILLDNINLELIDVKTELYDTLWIAMQNTCQSINRSVTGSTAIQQAVKYIDKNYAKNLTLEMVAREVYLTPSYLSSLFKQVLGVNYLDYLNGHRVDKAKEMFTKGIYKVYEVAWSVGYSDEKYFAQIFKKYVGITPSQFKDLLGEKADDKA